MVIPLSLSSSKECVWGVTGSCASKVTAEGVVGSLGPDSISQSFLGVLVIVISWLSATAEASLL